MLFEKGHKKAGGKKAGTPNKRTVKVLKSIETVLTMLDGTIEADLKALKARERAMMWVDLQEYIRPKLSRAELTGKDGEELQTNVFAGMTFEQMYQLKYGKRPTK